MSLSVSGIIAIVSIPERIELKGGRNVMYVFDAIAADTYDPKKRHKYKTSVILPLSEEENAVKRLVRNKVLQIHHGQWRAEEKPFGEKKIVDNKLSLLWSNISVLEWASKKQKGESNEQPN